MTVTAHEDGGRDMTRADSGGQVSPPARRPWAASVASALLFGIGLLSVFGYGAAEDTRWAAMTAQCGRLLPISRQMYVTAYAGPVFTLAAIVLSVRSLRRSTGPGPPATATVVFAVSLLLFVYQVLGVWWLHHDPALHQPISCA
jgi:hypothetical protein